MGGWSGHRLHGDRDSESGGRPFGPGGHRLPGRGEDPVRDRPSCVLETSWAEGHLGDRRGQGAVGPRDETAQRSFDLIESSVDRLLIDDAVLGLAEDGGWWGLGLQQPDAGLLLGVLPSRDDTGRCQRARLVAAGLSVYDLPVLRDVDTLADALAVRRLCVHGQFAAALDDVVTAPLPA